MKITFADSNNNPYGTVEVTPTSINVGNEMWWLLNKIFPTGLYPYLDPSNTFMQFKGLPPVIHVRHIGQVRVYKS